MDQNLLLLYQILSNKTFEQEFNFGSLKKSQTRYVYLLKQFKRLLLKQSSGSLGVSGLMEVYNTAF